MVLGDIMKEISFIKNSEWIKNRIGINGINSPCIECCFSKRYIRKTPNCADVKENLNIPKGQCGGGYNGHYERS